MSYIRIPIKKNQKINYDGTKPTEHRADKSAEVTISDLVGEDGYMAKLDTKISLGSRYSWSYIPDFLDFFSGADERYLGVSPLPITKRVVNNISIANVNTDYNSGNRYARGIISGFPELYYIHSISLPKDNEDFIHKITRVRNRVKLTDVVINDAYTSRIEENINKLEVLEDDPIETDIYAKTTIMVSPKFMVSDLQHPIEYIDNISMFLSIADYLNEQSNQQKFLESNHDRIEVNPEDDAIVTFRKNREKFKKSSSNLIETNIYYPHILPIMVTVNNHKDTVSKIERVYGFDKDEPAYYFDVPKLMSMLKEILSNGVETQCELITLINNNNSDHGDFAPLSYFIKDIETNTFYRLAEFNITNNSPNYTVSVESDFTDTVIKGTASDVMNHHKVVLQSEDGVVDQDI